eukprot:866234_1
MPAAAASQGSATNLGNAFDLLQRAGMGGGQDNFQAPHHAHGMPNFGAASAPRNPSVVAAVPQANPHFAAAMQARNLGYNNHGNNSPSISQPSSLSEQAMQRLQQFSAYQAAMGDAPQLPFAGRY